MSGLQRGRSGLLLTSFGLMPDQASLFAIQTRLRYETKGTAKLHEKGLKTFLPLGSATHQWSDRQRLVAKATGRTQGFQDRVLRRFNQSRLLNHKLQCKEKLRRDCTCLKP
jgi:hypothetical protein